MSYKCVLFFPLMENHFCVMQLWTEPLAIALDSCWNGIGICMAYLNIDAVGSKQTLYRQSVNVSLNSTLVYL